MSTLKIKKERKHTKSDIHQWKNKSTIEIINKTKDGFFEKINKTGNEIAWIKKEKKVTTQIDNIRNENEDINRYPTDMFFF